MPRTLPSQSKPAVAASATSHGTTAGEGPGANGLSQGRVRSRKAGMESSNVIERALSLQGYAARPRSACFIASNNPANRNLAWSTGVSSS